MHSTVDGRRALSGRRRCRCSYSWPPQTEGGNDGAFIRPRYQLGRSVQRNPSDDHTRARGISLFWLFGLLPCPRFCSPDRLQRGVAVAPRSWPAGDVPDRWRRSTTDRQIAFPVGATVRWIQQDIYTSRDATGCNGMQQGCARLHVSTHQWPGPRASQPTLPNKDDEYPRHAGLGPAIRLDCKSGLWMCGRSPIQCMHIPRSTQSLVESAIVPACAERASHCRQAGPGTAPRWRARQSAQQRQRGSTEHNTAYTQMVSDARKIPQSEHACMPISCPGGGIVFSRR